MLRGLYVAFPKHVSLRLITFHQQRCSQHNLRQRRLLASTPRGAELAGLQEGAVEKHRIHDLILQADAKQQPVQDSIAARPRGGARDELISELIQSRLAVSRAQMNAEAGVSEQMIEEQQEVIACLWQILEHAGMSQAQVTLSSILGPIPDQLCFLWFLNVRNSTFRMCHPNPDKPGTPKA